MFNARLTRLEKITCTVTAVFVAGACYLPGNFLVYLGYAFMLDMGLQFAIWWAKNWFGGNF